MVIVPYESFGPVRFGSTEEEVVAAMGKPDYAREKRLSFGFCQLHFEAFGCESAESEGSLDVYANGRIG